MKTIGVIDERAVPQNYTGKAAFPNGTVKWFANGKCHRTDGPAIIYSDGDQYWYFQGKLHREDGPAVDWRSGRKEYWLDGHPINPDKIQELFDLDYPEKTAIKLASLNK